MDTALPYDSRELPPGGGAPQSHYQRLTQHAADDEVLVAGLFMPNAVGRGEMSTLTGMSQRQRMKCRRGYLGERILLGLTCLHLYLVPPMIGWPVVGPRYLVDVRRIDRADLRTVEVPNAVPGLGPAIRMRDARRNVDLAELRMRVLDDGAKRLVDLLLGRGGVPLGYV
jgi:hypothetical protein